MKYFIVEAWKINNRYSLFTGKCNYAYYGIRCKYRLGHTQHHSA